MKFIRWFLGRILIFLDWVIPAGSTKRTPEAQRQVDSETAQLKLYQFEACPFCIKVRRSMRKLSLKIDILDAKKEGQHRTDLEKGGGRIKVPCLKIEESGQARWMYESSDIIRYLNSRFAP